MPLTDERTSDAPSFGVRERAEDYLDLAIEGFLV
jgi:hypothetical protein